MAYNGVGVYTPPALVFPAVSGTTIEASKFNTLVNDISDALSTAVTKDGQTAVAGDLPMTGFKHTGVGNASARDEYAAAGQVQNNAFTWAGTAGGTANAITLTLSPAITAYAAGQSFTYKSGASANTGATTVNINSIGAKAIQKNGSALAAGDHPANRWFRITYDGAAFQLEQITTAGIGFVSVTDFGAVGDGVTDCTTAFQAALDNTAAKELFIPAGDYVLSATLTHSGKALAIRGAGIGITRLIWASSAASVGFSFAQADDDYYLNIEGMSFITGKAGTGTAIYVDGSGQISGGIVQGRSQPRLLAQNLEFRGSTGVSTDGWGVGIDCVNVMAAAVRGLYFAGKYTTTATNIISESMCRFSGSGSPVHINVANCDAYYCLETVKFTDVEGAYIRDCNLVSVSKGVVFNPAVNEPQLQCISNHINAYVSCIEASNVAQSNITQNLLYSRSGATVVVTGIKLSGNSLSNNVSDNVFVAAAGAGTLNGIIFESGVTYNLISNNVFQSALTAIELKAGADNNTVSDNMFGASITTRLLDSGTGNIAVLVRSNSITVNAADAKIELGSETTASTPFIDLKSSGNPDYDVRISASGGNSVTPGLGTLTYTAAANVFGGPLYYGANQVVGSRSTGWTNALAGTANKATAYNTATITLVQLAERVKAIEDALRTHGLIGT